MVTTRLSHHPQNQAHRHGLLGHTSFWHTNSESVGGCEEIEIEIEIEIENDEDERPTKRARTALAMRDVHSCLPPSPRDIHSHMLPHAANTGGSNSHSSPAIGPVSNRYTPASAPPALFLERPMKALPSRGAHIPTNSNSNPNQSPHIHTSTSTLHLTKLDTHLNDPNLKAAIQQPQPQSPHLLLASPSSPPPPPPPRFSGTFHLFSTSSNVIPPSFAAAAAAAASADAGADVDYRALERILSNATALVDARCFLPDHTVTGGISTSTHSYSSSSSLDGLQGFIQSTLIRDPVSHECLRIGLHDIREEEGPSLGSSVPLRRQDSDVDMMMACAPTHEASCSPPSSSLCSSSSSSSSSHSHSHSGLPPPPAKSKSKSNPGLHAGALVIGDGPLSGIGSIVDSFGEFVIHRVWFGFTDDDVESDRTRSPVAMEVFRGHLVLKVFFGEGYVERGHEEMEGYGLEFWAVRGEALRSEMDYGR
ncbi:hypothetical protein F5878DRAFT_602015 [Lentinula raphanica]|uniref:Uncharacterized protein n=1 Tax=Lentinula raphanica TaxID=153919 RepID=A0AA38PK68_9AGAR|nr:hypothetical protein F5878DRAFT_602015 [Lentinula raphanica]